VSLEAHLRARRDDGRKLLVPYVTGGLGDDWIEVVRALAAAGADAIEVGIPFSDPVMDGPVVQEASERALKAGATPAGIVRSLSGVDAGVPLAVMTYYNLVFRAGHERFASSLAAAGIAGAILPDLPLDEAGEWCAAADAAGVETVLLAAPTTPDDRLAAICERSRGFVYAVGLLGVTGERSSVAASATVIAKRVKAVTDRPVLVGVGVSNAAQAAEVAAESDGVVVGSALVRRLLEGCGPEGAAEFVAELRAGLDG
jgi:tryptophan synthase alpha chain